VTAVRSVVLGLRAAILPRQILTIAELANADRQPPMSGSCSAPASGSATSPPRANSPRIWRSTAARAALAQCRESIAPVDRPDRAGDLNTRTIPFPANRGRRARARWASTTTGAAIRPAGGMLRVHLRAFATADNFLRSGAFRRGSGDRRPRPSSRILDWKRPGKPACCSAMGAGAHRARRRAAARQTLRPRHPDDAISALRWAGTSRNYTSMAVPVPRPRTVGYLRMEGREVFKHAGSAMITDVNSWMLSRPPGTTADDIDWFVPPPGPTKRIIDAFRAQSCILRRRRW